VVQILPVTADAVRPLRQAVLRPHQRPEDLVWPGDDVPGALHLGARDGGGGGGETLVGVVSIAPEAHPLDPRPGDWRIRGMATAPELRGRGIGAALLQACLEHARRHGGTRAWCSARTSAAGFYARAGFVTESDVFDKPGIGPHVVMSVGLTGLTPAEPTPGRE
jgi:GNAT superfamily N-acetyltransferase